MITDKDLDFHATDPDCHNWAETNYFAFWNAEHAVCGHLQALFRPNLGVVMSDVRVWRGLVERSDDTWYISNHFHMPIPEPRNLREYTLVNGLSVKALSPRDYRVDYVGIEDSSIHFDVRGIMEPYDIADPEMDPVTRKAKADSWTFSSAYNGHFDMSAHVKGTVTVRGETIPIDCVQVMDHSWGPRTEVDLSAMMWLGGEFDGLAIHAFFPADPANSETMSLAHGYVTEGGKVRGLTGGKLHVTRLAYQPMAIVFDAEDETGRKYRLHGATIAGGPWPVYPSVDVGLALVRWTMDGKVGHGMAMENSSMAYRTRHGKAAKR
jgi:hypothetical protein